MKTENNKLNGKNLKAKENAGKSAPPVMNTDENPIARRILARNVYEDNDTLLTQINNDDLIIGSSGAGKNRSYIIPNILRTDEDPK